MELVRLEIVLDVVVAWEVTALDPVPAGTVSAPDAAQGYPIRGVHPAITRIALSAGPQ